MFLLDDCHIAFVLLNSLDCSMKRRGRRKGIGETRKEKGERRKVRVMLRMSSIQPGNIPFEADRHAISVA